MNNKPRRKRSLFAVGTIIVVGILIFTVSVLTEMKNYDELLDADTMNVYSRGSFLGTFVEPQEIMDTYNGSVGVGVIDISDLGLKKTDFIELYTLEFVKNDAVISTIEMLQLQLNEESYKQIAADYFREFDCTYVIMQEDGHFFVFGQQFYNNLSRLLEHTEEDVAGS